MGGGQLLIPVTPPSGSQQYGTRDRFSYYKTATSPHRLFYHGQKTSCILLRPYA